MMKEIINLPEVIQKTGTISKVLKINSYHETAKGYTLLLFTHTNSYPVYIIKSFANEEYYDIIQNEYDNLNLLQKISDEEFKKSIPQPVYLGYSGDSCFLVQTGLSGFPMKSIRIKSIINLNRSSLRLLAEITRWNLQFSTLLAPRIEDSKSDLIEKIILNPIRQFNQFFGVSTEILSFIEKMADILIKYLNETVRLFYSHNDFCSSNILLSVNNSGIGVIDWEAKMAPQLPLLDLLHFYTCLAEDIHKKSSMNTASFFTTLHSFFFQRNRFSDFILNEINQFNHEFSLSPSLVLPIYTMYWIKSALEKYNYFADKLKINFSEKSIKKVIWKSMEDEIKPFSSCRISEGKLLNIDFLLQNERDFMIEKYGNS
ncbi:MAG: hypothetical protein A2161_00705 [Candidatus Schekmanbacteria bacterium RBG_13_48_7]|uniref:Aminoglycoside phosphotransferase domain-containing protein n=1 Tax=Candidatus Schekmanbacteria bacterium RBG_13_48_7 TaxID=1817878 RepID=A0A1F7RVZ4_9BACT|nr:MAG: hypothetical protein A2161_00705 [Candidatus Schekmanbacteria bacterium RBG_13_48_7]